MCPHAARDDEYPRCYVLSSSQQSFANYVLQVFTYPSSLLEFATRLSIQGHHATNDRLPLCDEYEAVGFGLDMNSRHHTRTTQFLIRIERDSHFSRSLFDSDVVNHGKLLQELTSTLSTLLLKSSFCHS